VGAFGHFIAYRRLIFVEHHHAIAAWPVFFGEKRPAELSLHAQHPEERRRDDAPVLLWASPEAATPALPRRAGFRPGSGFPVRCDVPGAGAAQMRRPTQFRRS
jgi:hypothetical protein